MAYKALCRVSYTGYCRPESLSFFLKFLKKIREKFKISEFCDFLGIIFDFLAIFQKKTGKREKKPDPNPQNELNRRAKRAYWATFDRILVENLS